MNDARQAFGSFLKAHREQRGISLSAVAETTKIGVALLAALERGDASRWPGGIFRRAFFREYAAAIGLSPDSVAPEFARLFPDPAALPASKTEPSLRLALERSERPYARLLRRAAVVACELVALGVVGAGAGWLLGTSAWTAAGVAALVYYPTANLFLERRVPRALATASGAQQDAGALAGERAGAEAPAVSVDSAAVLSEVEG